MAFENEPIMGYNPTVENEGEGPEEDYLSDGGPQIPEGDYERAEDMDPITLDPVVPDENRNQNVVKVADEMTGLLSKSSPYMKVARHNAMATANDRGLLNSSIAAGAGEKAAIEAAAPIAIADAADANKYGVGHAQNLEALEFEGDIKSNLLFEDAGYQKELENLTYENKQKLNEFLVESDAVLKEMDLTSAEVKAIGNSITLLGQSLTSEIAAIQQNPEVPPETKTIVIEQLESFYQAQVNSITSIYGVELSWD